MADITTDINQIKQADYGEDVRDNIVDALTKMNQETEAASKNAADATSAVSTAKPLIDALTGTDGDASDRYFGIKPFTGASDTADGKRGLVPDPVKGDNNKVLTGNAQWTDLKTLLGDDTSGLNKLTVFSPNHNGLVPGPADLSSDYVLCADAKWRQIVKTSGEGTTGSGSGGIDITDNPTEPIKWFSAKYLKTGYDAETDKSGCPEVHLTFDFQRWHLRGRNGKDYPVKEVHIYKSESGYPKSKDDLKNCTSVLDLTLNYTEKTKDGNIDYSKEPKNVDDLHKYSVDANAIIDGNVEEGKIYYYAIVLIVYSPVSKTDLTHFNQANTRKKVRIQVATKTDTSWSSASDETIAAMLDDANAGKIDLTDYWNIGDKRSVFFDEGEVKNNSSRNYSAHNNYLLLANEGGYDNVNYVILLFYAYHFVPSIIESASVPYSLFDSTDISSYLDSVFKYLPKVIRDRAKTFTTYYNRYDSDNQYKKYVSKISTLADVNYPGTFHPEVNEPKISYRGELGYLDAPLSAPLYATDNYGQFLDRFMSTTDDCISDPSHQYIYIFYGGLTADNQGKMALENCNITSTAFDNGGICCMICI